MKKNSKAGFTFVELLLVLSIVMIITTFSYYSYQPYHEKRQLDAFMEQFEKDVLFAQMCAMARKQTILVIFSDGASYRIRPLIMDDPIILDRHYDENVTIEFRNPAMKREIRFNSNGNIQTSGKIKISYKNQSYVVVFQLGKGRFYYE